MGLLLGLLLLAGTPYQDQTTNEAVYRRWAVIATPDVRATGIDDLLLVRLGERGFELVDRAHIADATREIELEQLLGPAAAGRRLELGRLLKADALVLLRFERGGDTPVLAAIIAETHYGARLRAVHQPTDPNQRAANVERLVTEVLDVRSRYNTGVTQIIGVPDFVSRNLTHTFDHLQTQLALVLQVGLGALPRTAVLELSEAQAIQAELDVTGGPLQDRHVPLFIEGEYEIGAPPITSTGPAIRPAETRPSASRPAGTRSDRSTRGSGLTQLPGDVEMAAERSVELRLFIKDHRAVRETLTQKFPSVSSAAAWLGSEVPAAIARQIGGDKPAVLPPERQAKLLTERAAAFEQLGELSRAAALRQAALLVQPGDVAQRCQVMRDHGAVVKRTLAGWSYDDPPSGVEVECFLRETLSNWHSGLDSAEFAVRNQLDEPLQLRDGLVALHHALWWELGLSYARPDDQSRFRNLSPAQQQTVAGWFERAEAHRREFVLNVLPMWLDQVQARARRPGEFESVFGLCAVDVGSSGRLEDFVFRTVDPRAYGTSRVEGRERHRLFPYTAADLALHARIAMEVGRGRIELSPSITSLTADVLRNDFVREFSDGQYLEFLERVKASEFLLNRVQAELSLAYWHFSRELPHDATSAEATIVQVRNIAAQYTPTSGNASLRYQRQIESLVRCVKDLAGSSTPAGSQPGAPTSAAGATESRPAEPKLLIDPSSLLHFEPFDYSVELRSGKVISGTDDSQPNYIHVTHGPPGWDFLWGRGSVALCSEPGTLHEKARDPGARYESVVWDGEYLWFSLRELGVRVADRQLRHLASANGGQELPPCDRGLQLAGLAAGKVLAVGSFGRDSRAWAAVLTVTNGQLSTEIVFEAKNADVTTNYLDLHAAFVPIQLFEYRCSQRPDGRLILIRRGAPGAVRYSARDHLDLLAFDPVTRTFAVCAMTSSSWAAFQYHFPNGDALVINERGLCLVPAHVSAERPGESTIVSAAGVDLSTPRVVGHGGYVYAFTDPVFRIDPRTRTAEMLGPDPQREFLHYPPARGCRYAEMPTSQWGLLFWSSFRHPCYRVSVTSDDPSITDALAGEHVLDVLDDRTGALLPGATLVMQTNGNHSPLELRRGSAILKWSGPGLDCATITAAKPGYTFAELTLRNDRETLALNRAYTLRLDPLIEIGGTVVGADGQPLPHAWVWLRVTRRQGRTPLIRYDYVAVADDQGRWREYCSEYELDGLLVTATHPTVEQSPDWNRNEKNERPDLLRAGTHQIMLKKGRGQLIRPGPASQPASRTESQEQH